jgi:hypothetical protein
LQRRLERFYHLEETPDVRDFVRESVDGLGRESLLLRESEDSVEMALVVPTTAANDHDHWLQLAEGVSHFVYVANRARQELPSTQLELELQAEVDKFVLLVLEQVPYDRGEAWQVHTRLYENVLYLHEAGTELGDRYRTADVGELDDRDLAGRAGTEQIATAALLGAEMLRRVRGLGPR